MTKMIMSRTARILCEVAQEQRPSWHDVIEIVRATTPKLDSPEETYSYTTIYGRIAEVYAMEQLHSAAQEIGGKVEFWPIPDRSVTKNYTFRYLDGTMLVHSRNTGKVVTDLDGLMLIGEEADPFLVEVKQAKYRQHGKRQRPLSRIMEDPHSLKGFAPVMEYYGGPDIGLIVAMPPDEFQPRYYNNQGKFLENGGYVVVSPFSLKEYKGLVLQLAKENNFKVA